MGFEDNCEMFPWKIFEEQINTAIPWKIFMIPAFKIYINKKAVDWHDHPFFFRQWTVINPPPPPTLCLYVNIFTKPNIFLHYSSSKECNPELSNFVICAFGTNRFSPALQGCI